MVATACTTPASASAHHCSVASAVIASTTTPIIRAMIRIRRLLTSVAVISEWRA